MKLFEIRVDINKPNTFIYNQFEVKEINNYFGLFFLFYEKDGYCDLINYWTKNLNKIRNDESEFYVCYLKSTDYEKQKERMIDFLKKKV